MDTRWEDLATWLSRDVMDLAATRAGLPVNDRAGAEAIAAAWRGGLNFVTGDGWYAWDGRCHAPDDGGVAGKSVIRYGRLLREVLDYARQQTAAEVARRLPGVAQAQVDKAVAQEWDKWKAQDGYARGLASNRGLNATASYLEKTLACPRSDFDDRHPYWLNHAGGTTDLEHGLVKPHEQADMIAYCLPDAYRPELTWRCPRFLALVHQMTGGSSAVTDYVLRVLGYALLGDNPEQLIFFLNGPTKSGKSQVLYIVRQILGALAWESQADLICYARHGRNARVENSIRGKRLVTISETSERMHIDEGQLKRLTGEPVITVDKHYEASRLPTKVSWTIIGSTNEMPAVGSMDSAVRERVVVIPCGPTIPVEYRVKGLAESVLAHERAAILATLAWYAAAYFRDRLRAPVEVEYATEIYCAQHNVAVQFAADQLDTGRGWADAIPAIDLWKAFQVWGKDLPMPGRNSFYRMLGDVPGVRFDDSRDRIVFRYVSWKQGSAAYPWGM